MGLAYLAHLLDPATLVGLAVAGLVLAGAWRLSRGGGGSALAEMERANGILERSLRDLRGRVDLLEAENAELKGRTDVAIAIERVMSAHEERAQRRFESTAVILDLIAKRLGPEDER